MFGEFESESPRVPSPWDLLTPPSSPPNIPKLVPEADEGNVEYKLQLLSPTPARFARLVTQLKWRLLEGGGQAYYELGVADSGMLVGLPRHQLEESLDTLEMMAGEIGASVIVVKEIEVPMELSTIAQSQIEKWDGKSSTGRRDFLRMVKQDESPTMSQTELETELSTTEVTDTEETSSPSPATPPPSFGGEFSIIQPRPSLNSFPFDSALAMFAVDIGEDVTDYADNEATDDDGAKSSINIEISSVYKPRPMKKRAIYIMPPQSTHFKSKKNFKNGYLLSKSTDDACRTGGSVAQNSSETHPQPKRAEAQPRKHKRDKRREVKLGTHPTVPTRRSTESPTKSVDSNTTILSSFKDETSGSVPEFHQIAAVDPPAADTSDTTAVVSQEPRLIVEALVVRKLSLDEVFLDFEGFSLQ